MWPIESLDKAINWYRDWISRASETAYGFFAVMTVPNRPPFPNEARDRKVCGVVCCFTGPKEEANAAIGEAKNRVGDPLVELVSLMPFPSLQSMHDALLPPGMIVYLSICESVFVSLSVCALCIHLFVWYPSILSVDISLSVCLSR